jgi:hypothetical protein
MNLSYILLILLSVTLAANADAVKVLPVQSTNDAPVVLLKLGSNPILPDLNNRQIRSVVGEVVRQDADTSLQIGQDEINSIRPGFGNWKIAFRFTNKQPQPANAYTFWARWRQGGVPEVCVQTFEVWAGKHADALQLRGSYNLRPKGWEYDWIAGEAVFNLNQDDTVIEIRNSGSGQDAKVFDAFLLASPTAALPVKTSDAQPVTLLELGHTPLFSTVNANANIRVQIGTVTAGQGAESVKIEKDEVQVFHQGFGNWDADFRFELQPNMIPGRYRFYARYKSGGEVSQVDQNFMIKAGAVPEALSMRANLTLNNNSPWQYQWLAGQSAITILPGDHWLEIHNTGKADGAKVFDAFILQLESRQGEWLSLAQAQLRNDFLAHAKQVDNAKQRLYLLDGQGENADILFKGLSGNAARLEYEAMAVSYISGVEIGALMPDVNLPGLPALVLTDDHYGIQGILHHPNTAEDVVDFLKHPQAGGQILKTQTDSTAQIFPLQKGVPVSWLIGGFQDGLAGLSIYGVDSETVIRPNPGQNYLSVQMMGGKIRTWQAVNTTHDGMTDLLASTDHSYGWSRGSGYAQLYLLADQDTQVQLHLKQSGINTAGWLDGKPFVFRDDGHPPASLNSTNQLATKLLQGLTTEGLVSTANMDRPEAPQIADLNLAAGWHSLLIKMAMQHEQGQRFYFQSLFTDAAGKPVESIKTRLTDPEADLATNNIAAHLRPLIYVNAPANLPHPGDSIKIRVDMRWHAVLEEPTLPMLLPGFQGKLRLRIVNYQGEEVAVQEKAGWFPNQLEFDFGVIKQPGYYAIYPSLLTPSGQLIMNYPADGFSVVAGNAEQKQRLQHKKLWNNNYYAFADGDKSFQQPGGYFSWLENMGIFKSLGSYPGFEPLYQSKWAEAQQKNLIIFADSSGDSSWLNDQQAAGENFIKAASAYTGFFKSTNEIDIRHEAEWQNLRDPQHWLQRAKWEYAQIHKLRNDGHYLGGSLVRPAEDPWFKRVLQLGLDQYQDAWDVHAYPQHEPEFGKPLGNGANEDEQGVLAVYASLGKTNKLPFWLGETGAKAMHGWTGRRWQAEQVAKIIAWVNSRKDYLGVAFCIAHEYDLGYGRVWDYSLGHKPGEAAMYVASALIDGFPYRKVDVQEEYIQAGYFGDTLMVWRTDGKAAVWQIRLDKAKRWLLVDVVGRKLSINIDENGKANIPLSNSPVYILPDEAYKQLTR